MNHVRPSLVGRLSKDESVFQYSSRASGGKARAKQTPLPRRRISNTDSNQMSPFVGEFSSNTESIRIHNCSEQRNVFFIE